VSGILGFLVVGFFFLERLEFLILELGASFLGLELWRAVRGLLVVVGPGGRISTVDCSRVLNVNRSLYSSTSRGRAQRDVLRAQRARLYAAPTCTTGEAPVYV